MKFKKNKLIFIFFLLWTSFALVNSSYVFAYIDPGTSGSLFNAVASLMPMVLAFFGFLLLPLKRAIKFILKKFKSKKSSNE